MNRREFIRNLTGFIVVGGSGISIAQTLKPVRKFEPYMRVAGFGFKAPKPEGTALTADYSSLYETVWKEISLKPFKNLSPVPTIDSWIVDS